MTRQTPSSDISRKILQKIGNPNLISELLAKLSPSEISTLQLALNKEVTNNSTPNDLLKKYESNRFAKPSKLDPIKVKQTELSMLEMAQQIGFSPVLLSPVSLLGSCSVIAEVDQNNVISATRGLEALSDSTNMLAIYLANGIKNKTMDNTKNPIHLASACRVTRAQKNQGTVFVPHFSLLTLVSAGKDKGSYTFEKESLTKHLEFYTKYFGTKQGFKLKVSLNQRSGYTDKTGFIERVYTHLHEAYPKLELVTNKQATDNSYYKGLNFKISINEVEQVDGGFVNWTQKLLGTKKERLLISGAGIDLQFITGLQ
jgi:hypothetical protein